jgi:hypothetical protein
VNERAGLEALRDREVLITGGLGPTLEHHAARAVDHQSVAAWRGFGRVARHPAVRALVVDESLKVGQQSHAQPISLQRLCKHHAQDAVDAEPGVRRGPGATHRKRAVPFPCAVGC